MIGTISWGALALLTVAGAFGVILARETMRLMVSLGIFLLGVAGLYLYYAMPLLAGAQVFLYVGGVLVLFLFALMALRRGREGAHIPRHSNLVAAATAGGLFAIMVACLLELGSVLPLAPFGPAGTEAAGDLLLGPYLAHFEIVGMVLLVALVAGLAIAAGGEE